MITAVNVSLGGPYFVSEEMEFIEVCVSLHGKLQRPVIVNISTQDASATG